MTNYLKKVCLVTGGARGIGLAIANKFAQHGGRVMVCDKEVDRSKLGLFHQNIVDFVDCDVSNKSDLENVFAETQRRLGNVDVLVNNAGIIRENRYEQMVFTNVLGVMHGVQLAFKHMAKGSSVVNIASLAGLTPTPVTPAYGATKAAVVAYTRNYGADIYYSRFGIRFVCFCPSFVMTNMADVAKWNPKDKVVTNLVEVMAGKAKEKDIFLTPEALTDDLFDVLPTAPNGSVWILKKGNKPRLVPEHRYEF